MVGAILEQEFIIMILMEALLIVGTWKIFKKCEMKAWWALIPAFREYQLSKCADREADGRKYVITTALSYVFDFIYMITGIDDIEGNAVDQNIWILIFMMLTLTVAIANLIYSIRIYSGLFDVFGVNHKWIWIVILFSDCIPAALLGLRKKYQPGVIYVDERDNEGAALSGMTAKVLDSGLTVNIDERTASSLFKKNILLRDIHLNIEPGHMVLLLGGSGAGKTTFVNAVNGYEKAKASIVLNGNDIYNDYAKMKYRIGFVPQMDLMRTNDTVFMTILDSAKLRLPANLSAEERRSKALEALRFFGLEPVKDKLCDKLSGGQRKRLSIAMEYISNPDLFILDEPDSGLDGVMARELMEGLRQIADQGKIVIVITHSPDRVIDLFDDVIVLAKDTKLTGRLSYFGSIEKAREFFEREEMERIVQRINRKEEGGEGLADMFIEKYAEVCNG
ncbi:ABC-type multidrug transport system, ATPase component [Eubacterium ruminantium]|nr:ABC-type multidrug transport system, ATPase component [Eubacterium ruminantium]